MSNESSTPSPSASERVGQAILGFIRALVRILLVLVFAVLLGVGIYFGVPAVYRNYVQPVEKNIASLNDANARQEDVNDQLDQRLDGLQSRLGDLEQQNDTYKQTLDELQFQLGNLEAEIQSIGEQDVGTRLGEVEAALETAGADLVQMQRDLAVINETLADTNVEVNVLTSQMQADELPLQALRYELQMVKAMEYLTRSRLSLVENNLGVAEQDLIAARAVLARLQSEVSEDEADALGTVLTRLDNAMDNLPARPLLAAQELEGAWQLLRIRAVGELTPEPTPAGGAVRGTPTPFPVTPTP